MKVLNIHKRKIATSKEKVVALLSTLATKEDKIWPKAKWPRMKFKNGLKVGAEGGHGPIRYKVIEYNPASCIVFRFQKPLGFEGIHKFEITKLDSGNTKIEHIIDMKTTGIGAIKWAIAIRWLHDALIEDAFDKVQNHLEGEVNKTEWNLWVKILRAIFK